MLRVKRRFHSCVVGSLVFLGSLGGVPMVAGDVAQPGTIITFDPVLFRLVLGRFC